jgi:structural maintenance of chromosome 3 (chondroitin sulfate proteoglycan 6)
MTAYVEIVFDNKDKRFPSDKDFLTLRRTIGTKKDEYSIDHKSQTKKDVESLLEVAGFSRANPYYIVKQGMVTELTNKSDQARLELLKDVAGTRVYEERRRDSLRIMDDTNQKRHNIDELLQTINQRLADLDRDKNELLEYHKKDKEKRAMQFTMATHDLEAAEQKLQGLDNARQNARDMDEEHEQECRKREGQLAALDEAIKESEQKIEMLKVEKAHFENEWKERSAEKVKLESEIEELTGGQDDAQRKKSQRDSKLRSLQQQITENEKALVKITPLYDDKKKEEQNVATQLNEATAQRERLRDKQGRSARYKSKKERDQNLSAKIDKIRMDGSRRRANKMEARDESIPQLEGQIRDLESEIVALRNEVDNHGNNTMKLATELQNARDKKLELSDERAELRREQEKLAQTVNTARDELRKSENDLGQRMDRSHARGFSRVRELQREGKIDGIHGIVADLFESTDMYRTAIEESIGMTLFDWVVDSPEVGSRIVDILNREKSGRVKFQLLDLAAPRNVNTRKAHDAHRLIEKIQYESEYENLMLSVFGNIVVCPDVGLAAQIARQWGVSAVTPEGHTAKRKGEMSGGYIDKDRSRLKALAEVSKWRAEYEKRDSKQKDTKQKLDQMEQLITAAVSDEMRASNNLNRATADHDRNRQEMRSKTEILRFTTVELEKVRAFLARLDAEDNEDNEALESFEAELQTEFKKTLSAEEELQLQSLNATIPEINRQLTQLSDEKCGLESKKTALESTLNTSLRQLDDLKAQDEDSTGVAAPSAKLQLAQGELKRIIKKYKQTQSRLQETTKAIDEAKKETTILDVERSKVQATHDEKTKENERRRANLVRFGRQKKECTEMIKGLQQTIAQLGMVPDEACAKYRNLNSESVSWPIPLLLTLALKRIRRLMLHIACETPRSHQQGPQKVQKRQQESPRTVHRLHDPPQDPHRAPQGTRLVAEEHRGAHLRPRHPQGRGHRAHLQASLQEL